MGIYGRMYNGHAVNDARGLCPPGWHVPTGEGFLALANFLGGESQAGVKLKASATDSPLWNGTNSTGWSGLPDGFINQFAQHLYAGSTDGIGYWWTSSINPISGELSTRHMNSSNDDLFEGSTRNDKGLSVRCLKD
jgi:uncharacterized protein (TIGR02145 family)